MMMMNLFKLAAAAANETYANRNEAENGMDMERRTDHSVIPCKHIT